MGTQIVYVDYIRIHPHGHHRAHGHRHRIHFPLASRAFPQGFDRAPGEADPPRRGAEGIHGVETFRRCGCERESEERAEGGALAGRAGIRSAAAAEAVVGGRRGAIRSREDRVRADVHRVSQGRWSRPGGTGAAASGFGVGAGPGRSHRADRSSSSSRAATRRARCTSACATPIPTGRAGTSTTATSAASPSTTASATA